jgi:hypothetical protein
LHQIQTDWQIARRDLSQKAGFTLSYTGRQKKERSPLSSRSQKKQKGGAFAPPEIALRKAVLI